MFIIWLLLSANLQANTVLRSLSDYSTVRVVMNSGKITFINGKQAQISITKPEMASGISFNDDGQTLEVKVDDKTSPEFVIIGGNIAAEAFVKEGNVVCKQWSSSVHVVIQKGSLTCLEGEGGVRAHVQDGDIEIGGRAGSVETESYEGKVTLKSIKGDVKVRHYSGAVSVETQEGKIDVSSQKARVRVVGGSGDLNFKSHSGPVTVVGFSGPVEGESEQGAVSIKALENVNLKLVSKDGPVDVFIPQKSAAGVAIDSFGGRVRSPKYLKVSPVGDASLVRGRLRGNIPGRIYVKTQTGRVTLKVE